MTVRLLGQDVALSRQKDGFKSHTVHYYGGSSMVEHLTENQKKRVRFSPFTNKKTCGRMVNAALLKSVAIKAMRVQIPPRPMLSLLPTWRNGRRGGLKILY